jgi:hypothetical protein
MDFATLVVFGSAGIILFAAFWLMAKYWPLTLFAFAALGFWIYASGDFNKSPAEASYIGWAMAAALIFLATVIVRAVFLGARKFVGEMGKRAGDDPAR